MATTPTVLLTGGAGFVGPAIADAFARSGWSGRVSTRQMAGQPPLPVGWGYRERAKLLMGEADFVPDVIVHLEVKQHVFHPTAADLEGFQTVNVDGTRAWLEWAARCGVKRFVLLSTIKAVEPRQRGAVTEESPVEPGNTPYGRSKWEAEEAVRAWMGKGKDRSVVIVRPAVVYGPGNTGNISAMVDGIARGRFCLVGRNDNRKALVSRANLAAAVIHLVSRMEAGCETYFITDKEVESVRWIAEAVSGMLGKGRAPALPLPVARVLARFGDLFGRLTGKVFPINGSRLQALLEETDFRCEKLVRTGFQHPQTLQDGLREMVGARENMGRLTPAATFKEGAHASQRAAIGEGEEDGKGKRGQ